MYGKLPAPYVDDSNRTLHTKKDARMAEETSPDALLTPAEVAALFRVNPKTVTRWARAGKITAIRTLGGHRRFRASEIRRCLEQMETESLA
jgi:excisionase family DNA binding protein